MYAVYVTLLFTVPNVPTLSCIVEETALTVHVTKAAGVADNFTLSCRECNDTLVHEGISSRRYANLVAYTSYSFTATAIAGSQSAFKKESAVAEIQCNTSVGRKYKYRIYKIMLHCLVVGLWSKDIKVRKKNHL